MKKFFLRLLNYSVNHNLAVILLTLFLTLCFAAAIPFIKIRADVQSLVPQSEETLDLFEEYHMPKSDYFIMAVEADDPFTQEGLAVFGDTINSVLAIPGVIKAITPFNQVVFQYNGSFPQILPVSPTEGVPQTPEDIAIFRERLTSNPFSKNLVISADQKTLVAFFQFDGIEDYTVFMGQVEKIIVPLEKHYTVAMTGFPPFEKDAKSFLLRDFSIFMGLGIIFILIMYYLGFRSVRSVILPVSVILMGTVWTLGFMSLMRFPISIISIVTPPLVLTLGSSYSIHLLNQYYRGSHFDHTDSSWVANAVVHVNKTIVLASVTTIVGFLSLLSTTLKQTKEFAIAASFGIFACAFMSLFFLPAVLSRLPVPSAKQFKDVREGFITRAMVRIGHFVFHFRWLLIILLIGIIVTFGLTFRFINHQTNYIEYFPEKSRALRDNLIINKAVGGLNQIYVTFDAPAGAEEDGAGYFLDPDVLKKIDKFEETLRANPDVTYILSFNTYVRELNGLKTGKKEIPDGKGLIMFLSRAFKGFAADSSQKDLINQIGNEDFSRYTISLNFFDGDTGKALSDSDMFLFVDEINRNLEETVGNDLTYHVWGSRVLYMTLYKIMNHDLFKSTALALVIIFLITALTFRSVRYGGMALVPMITGIALNFIFMVVAKIPMDMTTIMVSCVAIGIGVDDSIHFLIQFRRQQSLNPEGDKKSIILKTMEVAGRPIILTSISIIGGLMILVFSTFKPIGYFGLLVSTALLTTTMGCLLFLPAILSIGKK